MEMTLEEYVAMYTTSSPSGWEIFGKSCAIFFAMVIITCIVTFVVKYKNELKQLARPYENKHTRRK